MDDNEDDGRYPSNPYRQQGCGSSNHRKLTVRNNPYPIENQYVADDDDEDENEEEEDDEDYNDELDDADDDKDGYNENDDDVDLTKNPKKMKLKGLPSDYELTPRVSAPSAWNVSDTFVLLDACGEIFLRRGRRNLRGKGWEEVAEKVSEVSETERTVVQCRNRLDTLKKKYKKEKAMLAVTSSEWIYFERMEMIMSFPPKQGGLSGVLDSGDGNEDEDDYNENEDQQKGYDRKNDDVDLRRHPKNMKLKSLSSGYEFTPRVSAGSSSPPQQGGLSRGLDSGEYAFKNRDNGLDEVGDSLADSESTDGEEDDPDGLPPRKSKFKRRYGEGSSFGLIADMVQQFSNIYEKTEKNKMQKMSELGKMRMDFKREVEEEGKQIMERGQAEILKIHQQADDDENEPDDDKHTSE